MPHVFDHDIGQFSQCHTFWLPARRSTEVQKRKRNTEYVKYLIALEGGTTKSRKQQEREDRLKLERSSRLIGAEAAAEIRVVEEAATKAAAEEAAARKVAAKKVAEEKASAAAAEKKAALKAVGEKRGTEKKAVAEKAAAEKIAAEKAVSEKVAAEENVAVEEAAAEKKAAETKAAEEKAAAEKATAEKMTAEKAAVEKKAAEEKAAGDRAVARKAAAEKRAAEETAAADIVAAETAAAEKKAAEEKAAADKATADKRAAEEKAIAEKVATEEAAVEKEVAEEKAAAEKVATDKAAAERAVVEKKAAEETTAAEKAAAAAAEKVDLYFWEDACEWLSFCPPMPRIRQDKGTDKRDRDAPDERQEPDDNDLWKIYDAIAGCDIVPGKSGSERAGEYGENAFRACWAWRENEVYIDVIVDLALLFYQDRPKGDGAILIFLPGCDDIDKVFEKLFSSGENLKIVTLHSLMSPEQQHEAFDPAPEGFTKVVLSTNIAEASVTIDDVVYVIDCGVREERSYNPVAAISSLDTKMVTRANAIQRRGRAGRVREGIAVHLFPSYRFDALEEPPLPRMITSSTEEVPLQSKVICGGEPADSCERDAAMAAPSSPRRAHGGC